MEYEKRLFILEQLAKKYGTDKSQHGYIKYYAQYLPEKVKSFIEIGVLKGASCRMFDDYYDNKPEVFLIDLFEEEGNLTERLARSLGFRTFKGSQIDFETYSDLKVKADFCTEDASHNCFDQIFTFKHIFLNNLKNGGLYFMEDVHTSQPQESIYWGNGVDQFEDTPLWLFKNFLETGNIESKFFNSGEREIFLSLIDWVKIEANEKLIIIKRKD